MKRLLLTAALTGAMAIPAMAGAVAASPVQGNVGINANVDARCQFTAGGTATITIAELSNTATGVLDQTTVNGRTATLNGWCNGTTSSMSVQSSPLLNAGTAPTGFTNRVDYSATVTAHPAAGNVAVTDSSVGVLSTTGPATVGVFTSNIDVLLGSASSTGDKLLAGAYAGNVLVTLTPGL